MPRPAALTITAPLPSGATITAALRLADGVWQADLRKFGGGRLVLGDERLAAEARLRALLVQIHTANGSPAKAGLVSGRAPTVRERMADYQASLLKDGLTEDDVARQEQFLRVVFEGLTQVAGAKRMGAYTRQDVTRFIDVLPDLLRAAAAERAVIGRPAGAPLPPDHTHASSTLRKYVMAASGFWRWARDRFPDVPENPFERHRSTPSGLAEQPIEALTPAQAADLEAWCLAHIHAPDGSNPWLPVMLLTGMYSGTRPAELLTLRVGDVRLRDDLLHINGTKTRGSRRDVLLWPRLKRLLAWHIQRLANRSADAWLFPTPAGTPFVTLRQGWKGVVKRFGLSAGHRQVKCLRHTFASAALRVALPSAKGTFAPLSNGQMSEWLGHSNPVTLEKYLKPMPNARPLRGELDYQRLAGREPISIPEPRAARRQAGRSSTSAALDACRSADGATAQRMPSTRTASMSDRKRQRRPKRSAPRSAPR